MLRIFYFLLLVALYIKDASVDGSCHCCKQKNIENSYIDDKLICQYAGKRNDYNGRPVIPTKERNNNGKLSIYYYSTTKTASENVSIFFDWFKKNRNKKDLK
ncbi:MAG: hypothetical protein II393_01725 [Cytophagales bacterium]|nr:hypothetical protein [Cytophagales bacterium]